MSTLLQEAFDLIVGKMQAELESNNFQKIQDGAPSGGKPAIFVGENVAYAMHYNVKVKRFDLKMASVEDGKPGDEWKNLSQWLFDGENDTLRDAESIGNDFADTVAVNKKKAKAAPAKQQRSKKDKNGDRTADPIFFFNRLSAVFPEMKFSLQAMKNEYDGVLPVNYAKEAVVPLVKHLVEETEDEGKMTKMVEVFNSCYKSGSLDVKGIITIVILNSLEKEGFERLQDYMSDELKKAAKYGWKMRGKTVKPEVVKKSRLLAAQEATANLRQK